MELWWEAFSINNKEKPKSTQIVVVFYSVLTLSQIVDIMQTQTIYRVQFSKQFQPQHTTNNKTPLPLNCL